MDKILNIKNIDRLSPDITIQFGNDILDEFRNLMKLSTQELEKNKLDTSIIDSLNAILEEIDVSEIITTNQVSSGKFQKILDKLMKKKDRIITKYYGIAKSLDNMYINIKSMTVTLADSNKTILKLREDINELHDNKILPKINEGKNFIDSINIDTYKNNAIIIEAINILTKKIIDLEFACKTIEKQLISLQILSSTNYELYISLSSVYNTTMPDIQATINTFQVLKNQKEIITSVQYIKEKRNQLSELSVKEIIDIAKDSLELNGVTEQDFKVITEAIQTLTNGKEELKNLMVEHNNTINQILLEGAIQHEHEKLY